MKVKELTIKKPVYRDNIELFIKGDHNDADYVSETNFLSVKEFQNLLPILKKLKKNNHLSCHYAKDCILTEEESDILQDYLPFVDNAEIHSIESVQAWFLSKKDSIRYEIKI